MFRNNFITRYISVDLQKIYKSIPQRFSRVMMDRIADVNLFVERQKNFLICNILTSYFHLMSQQQKDVKGFNTAVLSLLLQGDP